MRVTRVELRDFRNYGRAAVELGERLTVVTGANGAGKTNLLEAIYFVCTGRSPRTSNERELIRLGSNVARVELEASTEGTRHRLEGGLALGEPKRMRIDGMPVDGLTAVEQRPLVSVFLPERLELVKGPPSGRRGHIDSVIAALWPARMETRTAYSRALAQRNALLGRIRTGAAAPASLDAWDVELARQGAQLMEDRREAVERLVPGFARQSRRLGLVGDAELRYRPRSAATDAEGLVVELTARRQPDLERGFTAHGPHRDDIQLLLDGESLRVFGSQGQQRTALLALLFAERDLLAEERWRPPLMLLDDVMSELDAARRELLAELLRADGQAVVTATDSDQVPGATDPDVAVLSVLDGTVVPMSPGVAA
jgi:DNA replication and repair protein RecF